MLLHKFNSTSLRRFNTLQRHFTTLLKTFATVDPERLTANDKTQNLIRGQWLDASKYIELPDPLNGGVMCKVADT